MSSRDAPLYFEGVLVTRRIAFRLAREFDLEALRRREGGKDRPLDATLRSLLEAACLHMAELSGSASAGTKRDEGPERGARSLQTHEVAELAEVSDSFVRRVAREGRIPHTVTAKGRQFNEVDVLDWIATRRTNGSTHAR